MRIATDGHLGGWRVQSELPLPELLVWGGENRDPDIEIVLGNCAELPDVAFAGPRFQVGPLGHVFRLVVPGVATFEIKRGKRVVVQPAEAHDPKMLRNYMLGSVFGVLCHQRGILPLHGACVSLPDGAVVFCGNSGAGKSTMASALVRKGHTLLCDDVSAIDLSGQHPLVLPAFPRVKLWPHALEAVGVAPDSHGLKSQEGKLDFRFAPTGVFSTAPVRLRAIYLLKSGAAATPVKVSEIPGARKLQILRAQIFRPKFSSVLRSQTALFTDASQVAASVAVRTLERPLDFSRMAECIGLLEQLHANQPENNLENEMRHSGG